MRPSIAQLRLLVGAMTTGRNMFQERSSKSCHAPAKHSHTRWQSQPAAAAALAASSSEIMCPMVTAMTSRRLHVMHAPQRAIRHLVHWQTPHHETAQSPGAVACHLTKAKCCPVQLAFEGLRHGEGLDPALPKFAGRAVAADRLSRRLKATWDAVQASSASAWRAFASKMASGSLF